MEQTGTETGTASIVDRDRGDTPGRQGARGGHEKTGNGTGRRRRAHISTMPSYIPTVRKDGMMKAACSNRRTADLATLSQCRVVSVTVLPFIMLNRKELQELYEVDSAYKEFRRASLSLSLSLVYCQLASH